MRKAPLIALAVVCLVFTLSWIMKSASANVDEASFGVVIDGFLVTFAAFLTLAIL